MYPERLRMRVNTHRLDNYHTLDLEMHRDFTLEKEVNSRDGEQGWRARVESKAGIVLLGNNSKKPTTFKRKPRSWQWSCRRVSPTSVS
jgi:hypothetical protein